MSPRAGAAGQHSIVEQFLGPGAAAGGLHALLGVREGDRTDDEIITALEGRLTRIDSHPQARTPEADEVRLALHAAAAQLLDRAARQRTPDTVARAPRGKRSHQHTLLRLEQDAVITLARYGGWNRRSLRRLTMLAMARGAKPGDVAGVLSHLAARRGGAAAAAVRKRPGPPRSALFGEPSSLAVPEAPDEPDGRPLAIVIGAVATGLTLVVAIALVLVALTSNTPAADTAAEDQATARTPVRPGDLPMAGGEELFPWQGERSTAPGDPKPAEPVTPTFDRLSDALAALDTAVDGLDIDPAEAVRSFDGAFAGVGAQWCNLTLAQQRAAQHDVGEFVYRAAQRPELTGPVVDAIARGGEPLAHPGAAIAPDKIWPTAWSVGILARLAHERDIGAVASREIEDRLRPLVGSALAVSGGFEQGVHAALWGLLPAMVADADPPDPNDDPWERWIDAAGFGEGVAQTTVLAALEWVVTTPAEPTESEPVRRAIESLTLACEWGEQAPARPWLIRMFADARASDADLHAITTALARRSRAPGVDVTMALPVRANTDSRDLLRERYAEVWAIDTEGPTLDDLAADWLAAAREAESAGQDDATMIERLATAAMLSRISEAARLRHAGLLDDAGVVIDEFDRPIESELAAWSQRQRPDLLSTEPGMSRWALSYLSAQRDLSERLKLLNDAAKLRITHPTDAEVLVTEAVRGSPAQARAAARTALLGQQPSAVLTLAMLEIAPRMPRTAQNAELVAALTASGTLSIDSPEWQLRTRRVLVQTALEQLAAEGDQGVIDALATVLGESYLARAMAGPTGSSGGTPPSLPPDQAAALLRLQWERLARQGGMGGGALEVEAVLARHASRLGLAEGPVQTFAAEQITAFELMTIAVASERLDQTVAVQALLTQVRTDRSHAGDIVEQIVIVERAFVTLWAIRLGQESPWG